MNETKETSFSDNKIILLNIKIPCGRHFSCSKVFSSKVKFTTVYFKDAIYRLLQRMVDNF